jgi:nucleotide-binding universal stress UspA family protein
MRIICATDFSGPGLAAIELGTKLAERLGDTLTIIHALDPTALFGPDVAAGVALEASLQEAAAEELAKWVERAEGCGVSAEARVLDGAAAPVILEAARAEDVRLVVIGTHGRKGLVHLFSGSVADQVAAEAPCPVVATHGSWRSAGIEGKRRLHLLVGSEGSPAADAAVDWVKGFRQLLPCDVTFFQPYWPPDEARRYGLDPLAGGGNANPELLALLERELRRCVGVLPGAGEVRFRFAAFDGHGTKMLLAEAERLEPDLIVVGGASRRGGGRGTAFGATALLRASRVPVACVPQTQRRPAKGRIPVTSTVLVGTDLSDFANEGIPAAYGLLRGTGGRVVICHVYKRGPHEDLGAAGLTTLPRLTPSDRYGTEELLRQLAPPEAAALGIASEVAVVESGSVPEALLQEAERIDADIVVLASHGHTRAARTVVGSVTEAVVRGSRRPVLVLHPGLR